MLIAGYGDAFSNLIVLVCADVQVTRRFLECLTVSVYSPDGKISILVYIVGVTFYGALPLSSLAGTDYSRSISGTGISSVCFDGQIQFELFLLMMSGYFKSTFEGLEFQQGLNGWNC
ncbi:hypothetical protein DPMN_108054 [Dreissena polymorpha]|uniref:Polyprenal reductase n=1 Tax=Dreissena polymorpha TaxID=45954 RepID=A0A9D4QKS0_DREPO|nr:hypothetical protein DPMN_108054 [Dreissena polymorpha]